MKKQENIVFYSCLKEELKLLEKLKQLELPDIQFSLTEQDLDEETAELSRNCNCVSINHSVRVDRRLLLKLHGNGVRYLSTRTAGLDHIDLECAREMGIQVENTGYSTNSVADYTIMLLFMVLRQAKQLIFRTAARNYRLMGTPGKEIQDMTVGVVGTGKIGSTVIQHLRGFGCKILAYDPYPKKELKEIISYVPFGILLQESDAVTLHIPATEENFHLMGKESFRKMKQGAVLVNTGRGSLVDTEALVSSLEKGKLFGAALDVVEGEGKYIYQDWQEQEEVDRNLTILKAFPNVIVTPHTAFYTEQAVDDMARNSFKNCLRFMGKMQK